MASDKKRGAWVAWLCLFLLTSLLFGCQGETDGIETVTTEELTVPHSIAEEIKTQAEDNRMKLTFGSYNIHHGSEVGFDMRVMGKCITDLGLDIVGLQEVDLNTARTDRLNTMKDLSIATGYPYYAFFKAIDYQGGEYGVAILSRYPILETRRFELDSEGVDEQRVLGLATIDVEGVTVNFFVTHLSYESLEIRQRQFAQLHTILSGYDNFVLTGDFNTSDFEEYRVIGGSDLVCDYGHKVPTFPKNMTTIDNIVYSKATWSFDAPKVLTKSYSDHYLLYATGVWLK